jgi:hypothetical protein
MGPSDFAAFPADRIMGAAKVAMSQLREVRYVGRLRSHGVPVTVDLEADSQGACRGTFGRGGGVAEVRSVYGRSLLKPDEAFWRATAGDRADDVIAAVGGRWVPDVNPELSTLCDLNTFFDGLVADPHATGTYRTVGRETLGGHEVVEIEQTVPQGTVDLYVRVDGTHYVVKLHRTAGASVAGLRFSAFDKTFDVDLPPDEDVADLSSLQQTPA